MWQRWNGTSHVFEKSDDNGSSWAPLPLSAATITEGILSYARLPAIVAFTNVKQTFSQPQIIATSASADWGLIVNNTSATDGHGIYVNLNAPGASGIPFRIDRGGGMIFMIAPSGAITSNSAGPHNFSASVPTSVALYLANLTNGTSAYATYRVSAGSTNCYVSSFSQSYSSGGGTTYDVGGSICLYGDGGGGISIVSATPNTVIRFYVGGSGQAQIRHHMTYDGGFYPNNDNSGYVGYHTNRYSLIRGTTITPGDLTFDNGWTVTEAEKLGLGAGLAFLDSDENLVALVGSGGFKDITALKYNRTTKRQRSLMERMDHPSLLDPRKLEVNG